MLRWQAMGRLRVCLGWMTAVSQRKKAELVALLGMRMRMRVRVRMRMRMA